jgi:hypothetical protein
VTVYGDVAVCQAALLTLDSQLSHPETLPKWSRSDRRAAWRAAVASGDVCTGATEWSAVLRRMSQLATAVKSEGPASPWLALCDPASTGLDRDTCVQCA